MLLLSALPNFIFEIDPRWMNGRFRKAASQRSTIKPMAGLGWKRSSLIGNFWFKRTDP
tara:strand:- start:173 stop:346 length:174 start_codon:yes stop_codon:yes gene_type:complete